VKIRFHQTFGAHAGRVRELDQDVITFGRLPTSDIAFDAHADLDASGNHAELRHEGGVWVLRDVGSRNGTLVRGKPIQRHEVADGDEIEFGTGGPRVKVELVTPAKPITAAGTLPATPILADKKYGQETLDAAVEAAAAKARAEALAGAETHRAPPKGTAVLPQDQLPSAGMLGGPAAVAGPLAPPAPIPAPPVAGPTQGSDSSTLWLVASLVGLFVLLSLCLVSCLVTAWLFSRA
jgi:pSer/pThr/pTyr-binding forkhead associated (FHA) protein